jgi:hypothetical protein
MYHLRITNNGVALAVPQQYGSASAAAAAMVDAMKFALQRIGETRSINVDVDLRQSALVIEALYGQIDAIMKYAGNESDLAELLEDRQYNTVPLNTLSWDADQRDYALGAYPDVTTDVPIPTVLGAGALWLEVWSD